MIWLLRARLVPHVLVLGSVIEVLSCALSSVGVPFVSLRSTLVHVSLAQVSSVVVPIAWATSLGRSSRIEQTAVHPLRGILGGCSAVVVAAMVGSGQLGDALFGGDVGLATSRTIAAMTGLVLIAFRWWGSGVAALLPVCYFIAATLLGEDTAHHVAWWAVPIAPARSSSATVVAAAVLVVGLAVFVSGIRRNERP